MPPSWISHRSADFDKCTNYEAAFTLAKDTFLNQSSGVVDDANNAGPAEEDEGVVVLERRRCVIFLSHGKACQGLESPQFLDKIGISPT